MLNWQHIIQILTDFFSMHYLNFDMIYHNKKSVREDTKVTPGALINLSDLPSAKLEGEKKAVANTKKHEIAASSAVGLKS